MEVVDFGWKNEASHRVASILRIGPWKEDNLRIEFGELARWAQRQGLLTGRWIFYHRGNDRWEACLEYRGKARAEGRIRLKMLPAARVARVIFNPDRVSSRLVYHGLHDWLRCRRRDGTIRWVGGSREMYPADPWKDKRAWAHCEVQFLVRR